MTTCVLVCTHSHVMLFAVESAKCLHACHIKQLPLNLYCWKCLDSGNRAQSTIDKAVNYEARCSCGVEKCSNDRSQKPRGWRQKSWDSDSGVGMLIVMTLPEHTCVYTCIYTCVYRVIKWGPYRQNFCIKLKTHLKSAFSFSVSSTSPNKYFASSSSSRSSSCKCASAHVWLCVCYTCGCVCLYVCVCVCVCVCERER